MPILGPFAPTHVGRDDVAGFIPFGDIYDVERMATELGFPIVEWRDVKKPKAEGQSNEAIGGWTVYARYDTIRTGLPRGNHIVSLLGLGAFDDCTLRRHISLTHGHPCRGLIYTSA